MRQLFFPKTARVFGALSRLLKRTANIRVSSFSDRFVAAEDVSPQASARVAADFGDQVTQAPDRALQFDGPPTMADLAFDISGVQPEVSYDFPTAAGILGMDSSVLSALCASGQVPGEYRGKWKTLYLSGATIRRLHECHNNPDEAFPAVPPPGM